MWNKNFKHARTPPFGQNGFCRESPKTFLSWYTGTMLPWGAIRKFAWPQDSCNMGDLYGLTTSTSRDECETPWQWECLPTFGWHYWRAKALTSIVRSEHLWNMLKGKTQRSASLGLLYASLGFAEIGLTNELKALAFRVKQLLSSLRRLGSLFGPRVIGPKKTSNKSISTCHRSIINSNQHQSQRNHDMA